MTSLKYLCNKSELPEKGEMLVKTIESQSIIIIKMDNGFVGFQRRCPHGLLPLDIFGAIVDDKIICKKHEYAWNLENGKSSQCMHHLKTYIIHVSESGVHVEIPEIN